jgi:hypothetical protein
VNSFLNKKFHVLRHKTIYVMRCASCVHARNFITKIHVFYSFEFLESQWDFYTFTPNLPRRTLTLHHLKYWSACAFQYFISKAPFLETQKCFAQYPHARTLANGGPQHQPTIDLMRYFNAGNRRTQVHKVRQTPATWNKSRDPIRARWPALSIRHFS